MTNIQQILSQIYWSNSMSTFYAKISVWVTSTVLVIIKCGNNLMQNRLILINDGCI